MGQAWTILADADPVSHWAPGTGGVPPLRSGRLVGDFDALLNATEGSTVSIPLLGEQTASGVVRRVMELAPGDWAWSGKLTNPRGSFFIEKNSKGWRGEINLAEGDLAFQIYPGTPGHPGTWMECRPRAELECAQVVDGDYDPDRPDVDASLSETNLQSRPGAPRVIYLDFNGGSVSNTYWNSEYNDDDPINFADSGMSRENRIRAWAHAAEDFRAFDVNVTTLLSAYQNAPSSQRIRVAITPTDSWYPDAKGGVARVGSYGGSSAVVWVWNLGWLSAGETISHEAGHALGLHHSGYLKIPDDFREYYRGHGEGANGWAPIMGYGANEARYLTTWDNGSYPWHSNTEDQKAILTVFLTPVADDHGGSTASATTLNPEGTGPVFNGSGVLGTSTDVDYFRLQLPEGTWAFQVTGNPYGKNANFTIQIRGPGNDVIDETDWANSTDATAAKQLSAGTHYLTVRSTSRPESDDDPGYPRYGQLGSYTVKVFPFGYEPTPPDVNAEELAGFELGSPSATLKVRYLDETAVETSTLGNGDVIMRRGPSGTPIQGALVSHTGSAGQRFATYRFDAPGPDWDIGEGGNYEFVVLAGAVTDNWGNPVEGKIVTNAALPDSDLSPPLVTAPEGFGNASEGETSYIFKVAFSDIAPVIVTDYGTNCVEVRRVTAGENQITQVAPFVPARLSVTSDNYNKLWSLQYRMTPPGGTWDETDIGQYDVWLRGGKVRDVNGNVCPSQKIGTFYLRKRLWQRTFDETGIVALWSLGSSWSIGQPQGSGSYGSDPTAASSGSNVLGYRLGSGTSALYQNDITEARFATSPKISTVGYQDISLQFRRWLSVAAGDRASIHVSRNGVAWTRVWQNPEDTSIHDTYWKLVEIPLPGHLANNAEELQVRFTMGPTDDATVGGGWNIDTVKIIAAGIYNPGRLIFNNVPFDLTEGATFNPVYTVRLDQAPLTNVTVEINPGSQLQTSRASLTFTPANYATPQSVGISAIDDQIVEGNHFASLSHQVAAGPIDPAFMGIQKLNLVRVTDDDSPLIAFQPQDKAVAPGQTATFGVGVFSTVSATALYQWYRGESGDTSVPISGATGPSADILLPTGSSQAIPVWVRVRTPLGKREDSQTAFLSPLRGYEAWKSLLLDHGYTAEELAASKFDLLDPDGDGLSHLLEYALGGQPYTNDRALLPVLSLERSVPEPSSPLTLAPRPDRGGSVDLVLTFGPMKPDIRYISEFGTDLVNWIIFKEESQEPVLGRLQPTETRVRIPTGGEAKLFARLRVVYVPD